MDNTLYYGDNLDILRRYIPDESVDLVYLDPPFNSNATYNVLFGDAKGAMSTAQIQAFDDTWHWDHSAAEALDDVLQYGGRGGPEPYPLDKIAQTRYYGATLPTPIDARPPRAETRDGRDSPDTRGVTPMLATQYSTPTRPAPNADPTAIAAILAKTLPAGHPYIVVDADPLARLVPLTDAQLAELAAQREAMEAAEYQRLTRRARRHPNGIKRHKARSARNQANSISWSWWKTEAYRLRRENAQALLAGGAA